MVASGPASTLAGSPGARRMSTNETVATTSITGMMASARWSRYVFTAGVERYLTIPAFQKWRNGPGSKPLRSRVTSRMKKSPILMRPTSS